MNRRDLLQTMGGAALLAGLAGAPARAQVERKTRIYRVRNLSLRQGEQGARVNQFLTSQLPLLQRHIHTLGIFNELIGPHSPMMLVLEGYSGLEEMQAADEAIAKDPGYRAALEKLEAGAEPPYDSNDEWLLRALDFSPEITPLKEAPKTPRVFELRVYHAPTERQLGYLHDRFRSAEVPIFHRSGVHPIFYADTMVGPNMPNLVYMMPFASLAEREKAWDAFGADPEWVKVRAESVAHGGQIVAQNAIRLLRPAAYSPIQ